MVTILKRVYVHWLFAANDFNIQMTHTCVCVCVCLYRLHWLAQMTLISQLMFLSSVASLVSQEKGEAAASLHHSAAVCQEGLCVCMYFSHFVDKV